MKKQIIVKTYKGNQQQAAEAFQVDALKMASQGYYPATQSWSQGSWGCRSFIVALLLCFILIGLLVFIYMFIVKPAGTLSVTYELRSSSEKEVSTESADEKICPRCAESVKSAANVCRYCGHEFS